MIVVKELGVKRSDWVLRDINLEVHSGDKIGIVGKSGAGKSTLLKAISGHLDIQEGSVAYHGKKIIGPSLKLIPGYTEVQLVDQEFKLDPYHTVEENIREALLHLERGERDQKVEEFLELSELGSIRHLKAHLISGGEKQRLAIVRALALEPEILILDEPFVHLDTRLKDKMMDYITSIIEESNMGVLIASHDGAELLGFVDKIVHLNNGGIQRLSESLEMYYAPDSMEQAELLGEINRMMSDGEEILFRPNEYRLSADGIPLKLIQRRDRGGVLHHYYTTNDNQFINLIALEPLDETIRIEINKVWKI